MNKIYAKYYNFLEVGDDYPTVIMGVLNLSPESFYKGSVYDSSSLQKGVKSMIENGAKMLDLGARSTAPWSEKISINEEVKRISTAMKIISNTIPKDVLLTIDTQYTEVAKEAYEFASKKGINILINDVSCLKTDPSLSDFIIQHNLPIILMASKSIPGDLCTVEEIITEFQNTISNLQDKGYDHKLIIVDPGIGHWIEKKTHIYDLKIIGNISDLKILNKPILAAISRKSFIGTTLNIPNPENRLNGTLAATAIAVYNGAHIIRTHDVSQQLFEIVKMAEEIRRNQ